MSDTGGLRVEAVTPRNVEAACRLAVRLDPGNEIPFFRCGIWRLNVAARAQRSGVGRYVVRALLDEARRRGGTRATVLWVPAPGGPGPFYKRLGFVPTGQHFHGEIVGALALDAA